MPADIRKLLSCQPRDPTANLDPEHAAFSSAPVENLDPEIPCYDTTSPTPARLNVDKERTAQGVGKRKRFFNSAWLDQFKWLVICNTTANGYCHICRDHAIRNNLPSFSKCGKTSFTTSGFTNWRKRKEKFATHQQSEFHREYLLKTTQLTDAPSVYTQVTDNLKKTQTLRRDCLLEHLDCIRLLARNGLALRNDDEDEGNLRQQLQHSPRHIPYIKKYLTDNRYSSHQITSQMVEQMYRHVMKELIGGVKSAGYFSIVIDETQDGAGIEQCALVLRYVDDEYIIHEVVIGLYQADKCDAKSLTDIIKTALLSLDLDIKLLRGQTYDGAAVLQGKHSDVAKRI